MARAVADHGSAGGVTLKFLATTLVGKRTKFDFDFKGGVTDAEGFASFTTVARDALEGTRVAPGSPEHNLHGEIGAIVSLNGAMVRLTEANFRSVMNEMVLRREANGEGYEERIMLAYTRPGAVVAPTAPAAPAARGVDGMDLA